MSIDLSIIVPCYNCKSYIEENVLTLLDYADGLSLNYEIVLIDDGSLDETLAVLETLGKDNSKLVVLNNQLNEGKFASIRKAVAASNGKVLIFTDSDLPYDLSAIFYSYKAILGGNIHLVVGDRSLLGSKYDKSLPLVRKICTKFLRTLVRLTSLGGINDSQCGFKAFRSDIATLIFPLLIEKRFAGDIELLYIALKYNLLIKKIPVRLKRSRDTSVRTFWTSVEIFLCLASLKLRWTQKRYDDANLFAISKQFYWSEDE